jgi:hypothetical protein
LAIIVSKATLARRRAQGEVNGSVSPEAPSAASDPIAALVDEAKRAVSVSADIRARKVAAVSSTASPTASLTAASAVALLFGDSRLDARTAPTEACLAAAVAYAEALPLAALDELAGHLAAD